MNRQENAASSSRSRLTVASAARDLLGAALTPSHRFCVAGCREPGRTLVLCHVLICGWRFLVTAASSRRISGAGCSRYEPVTRTSLSDSAPAACRETGPGSVARDQSSGRARVARCPSPFFDTLLYGDLLNDAAVGQIGVINRLEIQRDGLANILASLIERLPLGDASGQRRTEDGESPIIRRFEDDFQVHCDSPSIGRGRWTAEASDSLRFARAQILAATLEPRKHEGFTRSGHIRRFNWAAAQTGRTLSATEFPSASQYPTARQENHRVRFPPASRYD